MNRGRLSGSVGWIVRRGEGSVWFRELLNLLQSFEEAHEGFDKMSLITEAVSTFQENISFHFQVNCVESL